MKFSWYTNDGHCYTKIIYDKEEQLKFIEWLETDPNVIQWY